MMDLLTLVKSTLVSKILKTIGDKLIAQISVSSLVIVHSSLLNVISHGVVKPFMITLLLS